MCLVTEKLKTEKPIQICHAISWEARDRPRMVVPSLAHRSWDHGVCPTMVMATPTPANRMAATCFHHDGFIICQFVSIIFSLATQFWASQFTECIVNKSRVVHNLNIVKLRD